MYKYARNEISVPRIVKNRADGKIEINLKIATTLVIDQGVIGEPIAA